jgi:proline dehydrogenase
MPMGVMRSALLAASESRWLRRQAPQMGFVKKAVRRFMPGERVEDAIAAALDLRPQGITAVLTKLGENVTEWAVAVDVAVHYQDVLAKIAASGLDCQISVKLTQLGLDVDRERCFEHLRLLAERALPYGNVVWIDMEQHAYVDVTLELYRRVLAELPNVGVCLQAYLYRTAADLASLIPLGGGVRLVKGAYLEPATIAYPKKSDVDENFLKLAQQMIGPEARASRFRAVFGTHDPRLIRAIQEHAASTGVARDGFEFALLYGIQRGEQLRLAQEHARIRVLIAYGDYWFPWYMRRLAERPANVLFVARSMFSS